MLPKACERFQGPSRKAVFSLFLFLLLISPLTAFGQQPGFQINPGGEIRYGALEIYPGLGYGLVFDDNIFKDDTGEVDDLINSITPSLGLRLPFAGARHEVSLYTEGRIFVFQDRSSEDHEDVLTRGSVTLRPGRRLEVNGSLSYEDTEDPSTSEAQSVTGPRTPRTQLVGTAGGRWTFSPKTRFSLAGSHTRDRFGRAANARLEKDVFTVTAEAFRQIFPKTSAVLSYTLGGTEFTKRAATDSNDDSLTHQVLAGVDIDPTAKVSGRATVGATVRDFDLAGRDTEVDFSVGTELTWRPLARTFLNLIILREFADTSTPGQFGLVRSTFQVTGNQAFTKYLAAHVLLRAVTDDFVSSARDDITYNVIVGGTYHLLRWLGVGLRYERESKDSDVSVNDYDQNQVILTLTVGLRSFLPAFP